MTELPAPLGQSPQFLAHLDHISRVAPVDRPVLIIGERGTGKELSAARVHFLSKRWQGPFIKLNCAALPESLLEAELFGVEAGAFTGAARRRQGRFELAHTGSMFLDEIGNAPLSVQEKILRVIEYGEFERLGGTDTLQVSVRVVAATNVDLPAEAAAGRFRDDLLDRLAFDVLTLPPLRARAGDLGVLAEHFGRDMAKLLGWQAFHGFAPSVMDRLATHTWPGNVRELKNVVERAIAHWPDPAAAVGAVDLDPFASPHRPKTRSPTVQGPAVASTAPEITTSEVTDFTAAVSAYERRILAAALDGARHNQRIAAKRIGLGYHQFRNQLRKHQLLPSQGAR
jgi:psp operon transcriptional activator